jgi:hypothetical protein
MVECVEKKSLRRGGLTTCCPLARCNRLKSVQPSPLATSESQVSWLVSGFNTPNQRPHLKLGSPVHRVGLPAKIRIIERV